MDKQPSSLGAEEADADGRDCPSHGAPLRLVENMPGNYPKCSLGWTVSQPGRLTSLPPDSICEFRSDPADVCEGSALREVLETGTHICYTGTPGAVAGAPAEFL